MKKNPIIAACFAVLLITWCGGKETAEVERPVPQKLAPVANVSLDSNPSSQTVTLSRDVESEGAILSLRDNSSWIKRLSLNGNLVTFDVEENPNRVTGHRFDTIVVSVGNVRIGTVCVSQARNRRAAEKLQWENSNAIYKDKSLPDGLETGKELTMFIYNLEKTTGGADSYKNYPAFAYCIEMNHDPANDMEWHLGARSEGRSMPISPGIIGMPTMCAALMPMSSGIGWGLWFERSRSAIVSMLFVTERWIEE